MASSEIDNKNNTAAWYGYDVTMSVANNLSRSGITPTMVMELPDNELLKLDFMKPRLLKGLRKAVTKEQKAGAIVASERDILLSEQESLKYNRSSQMPRYNPTTYEFPQMQLAQQSSQQALVSSPAATKPEVIEQRSEVGTPESGVATISVSATLTNEYVPAAWPRWYSSKYIRSLPNPTDRFMRDFGAKLYEEDMPLDPQISSTLSILVMAVLAEGVQLNPPERFDELSEQEQAQADRYLKFHQTNFDNLAHPLTQILDQALDGMFKIGHKVLEQVYEPRTFEGENGPMIALKDLKPKPYNATAFVVDTFYNVLGLWHNRMGLLPSSIAFVGPDNASQLIPRQKFAIPTWKPKNNDPRGTSHLAHVYASWWEKQGTRPEHMAYIARFGQPSVGYELPENAQDIDVLDAQGNPTGAKKSIVEAATEALLGWQSGGVFVGANGGKLTMYQASGSGDVFFKTYEVEDRQIAKGILMQTLTTEEAKHMARAASSTHQDVFGIFIHFVRSLIEEMFEQEVVRWLHIYNFGEDTLYLMPRVSLGVTEQQDWSSEVKAIASLQQSGYIEDSQYPGFDRRIGADPRDMAAWQAAKERKAQVAMAKAQKPPPVATGEQSGQGTQ